MSWRCALTDPPPMGDMVLLWSPEWDEIAPGYRAYPTDPVEYLGGFFSGMDEAWCGEPCNPTHWLEIPAPPNGETSL